LRLLKLPPVVQGYVRDGRLSVGHAKVILGLTTDKLQLLAAERTIKEALNVRQTEGLVARLQARSSGTGGKSMPGLRQRTRMSPAWKTSARALGHKVQLRLPQGQRVARSRVLQRCRAGTHSPDSRVTSD